MKKNILNNILIVCVLITIVSCKAKKEVIKSPSPAAKVDNTKKDKLAAINSAQSTFNTLSIKAKADLNIDNSTHDVSMNIRIKNNEMIWVSVTAIVGLEVARALITPDSVKILDRWGNTYTKKPFSYIYEFTNRQINFQTLQSILVGNTIKEFVTNKSDLLIQGNQTILSGILNSLAYNIQLNEHNKTVQTTLKDEKAGQMLTVNYSDFIPVSANTIPHTLNLKSQASRKNIQIDFKYTRVNINEVLDFPFSIPKKFTVKE